MSIKYWLIASITILSLCLTPVTYSQEFSGNDSDKIWQIRDITTYTSMPGDYLVIYIPTGTGYLINDDANIYAEFPVLSGQPRNVYYIGRSYFAATPEQKWEIKEKNIKRDRVTFGSTGEFFRLYKDDKSTPYGIHGNKYSQQQIDKGEIYLSMGCIIVQDQTLKTIEASYLSNNKTLGVLTTSDITEIEFLNN